jgi:hypothetical protein
LFFTLFPPLEGIEREMLFGFSPPNGEESI